jgi:hypothetical protein
MTAAVGHGTTTKPPAEDLDGTRLAAGYRAADAGPRFFFDLPSSPDREAPVDHKLTIVNVQVTPVPICTASPKGFKPAQQLPVRTRR